jgi:DNA-binding transcriptional LysR family regulator
MNLRNIDLNLLVTLEALLSEQHVTRAAQRLALSQSAVSTQLNKLRDLFGDRLFVPLARGVVPTQRALDLQAPLKRLLSELDAFVSHGKSFDAATTDEQFHLASTGALHFTFCVPLARRVREQAPGLRLALHQLDLSQAASKLEHGELDLVLSTTSLVDPGWKIHKVLQERFVTVMRRDHPAASKPMGLDEFCALDHLLVSPQAGGFVGAVDNVLQALGRSRKVVMSVQNFLVVPHILQATDMVATLPWRLSQGFPDSLCVIEPPIDIPRFTVCTAWHPRSQSDPLNQWVRDAISQIGEQL